jgi:hypothetical protein
MSNEQYNISFFLKYLRTPNQNPVSDILNNEEMRKAFSPLMINRFVSFSKIKRNQYLAQLMNRYVFWFYYQPEIPFGLMYLLHDKSRQFERVNYIRMSSTNKKKQKYDDVVYDVIRKACNCEYLKKSEIDEYIQFFIERKPEELINIMFKAGFKKSEISKLIPELKPYLKSIKEPKLTKKELRSIVNELKHTTQQQTTQPIQVNTDDLL